MFGQTRRLLKYGILLVLVVMSHTSHAAWPWENPPAPTGPNSQAVVDTIAGSNSCRALGDFYWEMGDANGVLTKGQVGRRFDANSVVNLASASKWPFATYFVQKFGLPDDKQIQGLTMRSGYVNMVDATCTLQLNINGCFTAPSPLLPLNSRISQDLVDRFYYNSGNFQKVAVDAGLGNMTVLGLTGDMRKLLGISSGLNYLYPGVASGLYMSANAYASMLRKIMSNQLAMGGMLELGRTCTLAETCPTSDRSPVVYDWDYGLGHWIERESGGNDEAYSSVGFNGFYPWITTDMQYYGVVSLERSTGIAQEAIDCGRLLRKSWLTGSVQRQ